MADPIQHEPSYEELRERLELAEQTLDAIHHGEVDALMIATPSGPRVYTLQGADEFYRAFVEQMGEGAAAVRPDGTILFANQALASLLQVPLGSLVGGNLLSLVVRRDRAVAADLLAPGGGIDEAALGLIAAPGTRENVPVHIYAREVSTHAGDPTMCLLVVDQTQRLEAEQARRLAELAEHAQAATARRVFLAELIEELAGFIEPDAAMRCLAERVVPRLADWSTVTVFEEDGTPRTVGWAHRDPTCEPAVAAIALGRATLDGSDQLRADGTLVLPLTGRGRTFGELMLATTSERGEHTEIEKALALDLALRAGPALDAARITQRSQTLAESMQRTLLTTTDPPAHLTVATRYRPAHIDREVGGDWYDTFSLPGGSTVVSIGDVMGHDLAAIAGMAHLRTMMRTSSWSLRHSPAEALSATDHANFGLGLRTLATAITAEIDTPARDGSVVFMWSNAGHPPPVLLLPDGSTSLLPERPNVPLGVNVGAKRDNHTITLPVGSTLLLYTDGLIERRSRDLDAGFDDLLHAMEARQHDSLDEILDDLLDTLAETDLRDDVALLAVRVGVAADAADPRQTQLDLPVDHTAPSIGRAHIAEVTASLPDVLQDDALLLTSELIANAIRSGSAPITLRTRLSSDSFEVAVHDHSPGLPTMPTKQPRSTAPNGRGLLIVSKLADDWGVSPDEQGTGKAVWFTIRMRPVG